LCQACHDYQHAKEQLINNIMGYLDQLKRLSNDKRKAYLMRKIGINLYRLEVLELQNTVMFIQQRGYYKYWDNEKTRDEKTIYKLVPSIQIKQEGK
jgi:hypothetical protein